MLSSVASTHQNHQVMHYDKNEFILLYNNDNDKDRKTLAYALTISKKINRQEINSVRISDTLFGMFLDRLRVDGKMLVNKSDPYYQENIRGHELTNDEWYSVLISRPSLLRSPVAMYRNKCVICETPTDVYRVT